MKKIISLALSLCFLSITNAFSNTTCYSDPSYNADFQGTCPYICAGCGMGTWSGGEGDSSFGPAMTCGCTNGTTCTVPSSLMTSQLAQRGCPYACKDTNWNISQGWAASNSSCDPDQGSCNCPTTKKAKKPAHSRT